MYLVYLLPADRMTYHAFESKEAVLREGDYPSWGSEMTVSDGFTDAVMVSKAIFSDDSVSLTERVMRNPGTYAKGFHTKVDLVYNALSDSFEKTTSYYARYWHGYLLVLKPLMLFFNVHEIRIISMILIISLIVLCSLLVNKRFGALYCVPLVAGMIFINPITSALSFQFADIFYITYITLCLLILLEKKLKKKDTFYLLFLADGICCAYFDFLTYPVVALGVPLVFCALMDKRLTGVIQNSVCWVMGYGFMWSGKWILSYLLTGHNIIREAADQAKYRSGVVLGATDNMEEVSRLLGLKKNVQYVSRNPITIFIYIVAASLAVAAVCRLIRYKREPSFEIGGRKALLRRELNLLIISLYPFVWYIVMVNHSVVHPFITFRNLCVSVTGLLMGLVCILDWVGCCKSKGDI